MCGSPISLEVAFCVDCAAAAENEARVVTFCIEVCLSTLLTREHLVVVVGREDWVAEASSHGFMAKRDSSRAADLEHYYMLHGLMMLPR